MSRNLPAGRAGLTKNKKSRVETNLEQLIQYSSQTCVYLHASLPGQKAHDDVSVAGGGGGPDLAVGVRPGSGDGRVADAARDLVSLAVGGDARGDAALRVQCQGADGVVVVLVARRCRGLLAGRGRPERAVEEVVGAAVVRGARLDVLREAEGWGF